MGLEIVNINAYRAVVVWLLWQLSLPPLAAPFRSVSTCLPLTCLRRSRRNPCRRRHSRCSAPQSATGDQYGDDLLAKLSIKPTFGFTAIHKSILYAVASSSEQVVGLSS